eukprot:scaffold3695_cov398-Prasinococcus_capsulatus_cf.AAC.3
MIAPGTCQDGRVMLAASKRRGRKGPRATTPLQRARRWALRTKAPRCRKNRIRCGCRPLSALHTLREAPTATARSAPEQASFPPKATAGPQSCHTQSGQTEDPQNKPRSSRGLRGERARRRRRGSGLFGLSIAKSGAAEGPWGPTAAARAPGDQLDKYDVACDAGGRRKRARRVDSRRHVSPPGLCPGVASPNGFPQCVHSFSPPLSDVPTPLTGDQGRGGALLGPPEV